MICGVSRLASMLENPEGSGVIVEVGRGVAVAVAAALVFKPRLGNAGLDAKLAAKLFRNRDALLFGARGVVAVLEEFCGGGTSPRLNNAIAVGFM